jgi:hypothetical protein
LRGCGCGNTPTDPCCNWGNFAGGAKSPAAGLSPQQIATLQDAFQFQLRSDRPDKSWVSAAIGASAVISGSNRINDAGRGAGGLQCYVQYSTVFGLANYNNSAISAGLRYEF